VSDERNWQSADPPQPEAAAQPESETAQQPEPAVEDIQSAAETVQQSGDPEPEPPVTPVTSTDVKGWLAEHMAEMKEWVRREMDAAARGVHESLRRDQNP